MNVRTSGRPWLSPTVAARLAVPAFVLVVAAIAAWLPARRAVRVSPMAVLREE